MNQDLKKSSAATSKWPYLLIAPALAVILLILGFPVFRLITLSFQKFGLEEIIAGVPVWIGFDNFSTLVNDPEF